MEQQKTPKSQQNIKRKSDTTQFKMYYGATVMEMIWYWWKKNQRDPHNYSQLIISKEDRNMIYKR